MNILLLIIGFFLLVKCADIFVDGASDLAKALGIPSIVIGLTVVAFGTSMPEAAVSILAALEGENDIAVANVVGSNICNLLLVLGASSIVYPLRADKHVIVKDYAFMLLSSFVLWILVVDSFFELETTSIINRSEGAILLCFLGVYLYSTIIGLSNKEKNDSEKGKVNIKMILMIVLGAAGIVLGGNLVVNSSTSIAKKLGVSSQLIGLTIVALGTSLPELVTSVIAARKKETDIAIGNVLGSCLFNVFFILGTSCLLSPVTINYNAMMDITIMFMIGLMVYLFTLSNSRIGRTKGYIMLSIYALYVAYIIMR